MSTLYLILNAFTVSFPLTRSFEPRIRYAKKWKALFPGLLITAAFFISWDILFTKEGVWGFNPRYLTEHYLLGLPVEEWLFFITVPFASVFIYECVLYFFPKISTHQAHTYFSFGVAAGLFTLCLLNTGRAYTFWCFLFGSLFLAYIAFRNPPWLGKFWVTYSLHLVPFFIVNGILTGSFIEEQVVWYNNEENLAIRLHTIPLEDTVYSLLLLLMNITFFEWFKKYFKVRT